MTDKCNSERRLCACSERKEREREALACVRVCVCVCLIVCSSIIIMRITRALLVCSLVVALGAIVQASDHYDWRPDINPEIPHPGHGKPDIHPHIPHPDYDWDWRVHG